MNDPMPTKAVRSHDIEPSHLLEIANGHGSNVIRSATELNVFGQFGVLESIRLLEILIRFRKATHSGVTRWRDFDGARIIGQIQHLLSECHQHLGSSQRKKEMLIILFSRLVLPLAKISAGWYFTEYTGAEIRTIAICTGRHIPRVLVL
jgi:hypothetical protein